MASKRPQSRKDSCPERYTTSNTARRFAFGFAPPRDVAGLACEMAVQVR